LVVQKKGCKGKKPECPNDGFLWEWGDPLCTWAETFPSSISGSAPPRGQKLVNVTGENHGKIEFVTAAVAEDNRKKAVDLMDCGMQQMLKATDSCKGPSDTPGLRHITNATDAMANTCKLATCTLQDKFKKRTGTTWEDAAMRKKVASCYISFQLNAGINIEKVFDPNNSPAYLKTLKLVNSAAPLNKLTADDKERLRNIEPKVLRAAVALIRDDYYHLKHDGDGPGEASGGWQGLKKDWNLLPKVNWDMKKPFVDLVNHVYGAVFPGQFNPFWTVKCLMTTRQCIYSWRGEASSINMFRNANQLVFGVFEFRHPKKNALFKGIPTKNPAAKKEEKFAQLQRFLTDATTLALP
jgi:hypothetical protein